MKKSTINIILILILVCSFIVGCTPDIKDNGDTDIKPDNESQIVESDKKPTENDVSADEIETGTSANTTDKNTSADDGYKEDLKGDLPTLPSKTPTQSPENVGEKKPEVNSNSQSETVNKPEVPSSKEEVEKEPQVDSDKPVSKPEDKPSQSIPQDNVTNNADSENKKPDLPEESVPDEPNKKEETEQSPSVDTPSKDEDTPSKENFGTIILPDDEWED